MTTTETDAVISAAQAVISSAQNVMPDSMYMEIDALESALKAHEENEKIRYCNGKNCTAVDGKNHSAECVADYCKTTGMSDDAASPKDAEPTKSPLLDDFLNAGARENITHLNFPQNSDTLQRQLADMTADCDKWQTAYNDAVEIRGDLAKDAARFLCAFDTAYSLHGKAAANRWLKKLDAAIAAQSTGEPL